MLIMLRKFDMTMNLNLVWKQKPLLIHLMHMRYYFIWKHYMKLLLIHCSIQTEILCTKKWLLRVCHQKFIIQFTIYAIIITVYIMSSTTIISSILSFGSEFLLQVQFTFNFMPFIYGIWCKFFFYGIVGYEFNFYERKNDQNRLWAVDSENKKQNIIYIHNLESLSSSLSLRINITTNFSI